MPKETKQYQHMCGIQRMFHYSKSVKRTKLYVKGDLLSVQRNLQILAYVWQCILIRKERQLVKRHLSRFNRVLSFIRQKRPILEHSKALGFKYFINCFFHRLRRTFVWMHTYLSVSFFSFHSPLLSLNETHYTSKEIHQKRYIKRDLLSVKRDLPILTYLSVGFQSFHSLVLSPSALCCKIGPVMNKSNSDALLHESASGERKNRHQTNANKTRVFKWTTKGAGRVLGRTAWTVPVPAPYTMGQAA